MHSESRPRTGRRILGLFGPYRWQIVATVALIVFCVGLNVTGPLLLRAVINDALPTRNTRLLVELCSAMVLSGVVVSLVTILQDALVHRVSQGVVHRLRVDLYRRMQAMPLEFFSEESNSEIQSRLASDIGGISDSAGFTVHGALTSAVSLVATGAVLAVLSWPLAVASVVLALTMNMVNLRFNERRRRIAAARQEATARMLKLVGEDLTMPGVILGRTFGRYHRQSAAFRDLSEQISLSTYRQRMAGSSARAGISMTLACLPPLVYLMSDSPVTHMSLGTVVVVASLQTRLSAPIQYLLGLGGTTQSLKVMFERVFAYLDKEPAVTLAPEPAARTANDTVPALRTRGLGFAYGTSGGRAALADVSLDFPPGSTTVVVGTTGAGKSTLALLMAGLVRPGSGTVEIDGVPTAPEHLWSLVTLVSQDAAVFNATVRENLLFTEPDATDEELEQVLTAVRLREVLSRLPQGLDTVVGERGYQLSGGERQRLVLARALLAPAPILIVDEATSALDGVTAAALHTAIRSSRRGRTLIVIAHRIPAMRPDDQVVALSGGRVVDHGGHAAVARSGRLYPKLVRSQAQMTDSSGPEIRSPGEALASQPSHAVTIGGRR